MIDWLLNWCVWPLVIGIGVGVGILLGIVLLVIVCAVTANLLTRTGLLGPPARWERIGRRVDDQTAWPKNDRGERRRPLPGWRRARQVAGDPARLAQLGLPALESTDDVLAWLELSIGDFALLANPGGRVRQARGNYCEWGVPKRRSGVRIISAPKPRLKAVQQRIRREILDRLAPHDAAHGFVRGRDVVTNATPHVGRRLLCNFDLADFFEQITYPRVVGVFRWLGYSLEVSRGLALLCTHRPDLRVAPARTKPVWVRRPPRHAVQGAPTSPQLANLCCCRLDRRLAGLAARFDASYTRYADDLTFSGNEPFKRGMKRFRKLVFHVVAAEGFRIRERKTRFMRPGGRQQVTGIVVNRRVNLPRADYDRLKAIVHNARRAGSLESQNREGRPDFRAYVLGHAARLRRVHPERGLRLMEAIRALP